jgi:hypothetical protein
VHRAVYIQELDCITIGAEKLASDGLHAFWVESKFKWSLKEAFESPLLNYKVVSAAQVKSNTDSRFVQLQYFMERKWPYGIEEDG